MELKSDSVGVNFFSSFRLIPKSLIRLLFYFQKLNGVNGIVKNVAIAVEVALGCARVNAKMAKLATQVVKDLQQNLNHVTNKTVQVKNYLD